MENLQKSFVKYNFEKETSEFWQEDKTSFCWTRILWVEIKTLINLESLYCNDKDNKNKVAVLGCSESEQ